MGKEKELLSREYTEKKHHKVLGIVCSSKAILLHPITQSLVAPSWFLLITIIVLPQQSITFIGV